MPKKISFDWESCFVDLAAWPVAPKWLVQFSMMEWNTLFDIRGQRTTTI